ncbi:SAV_915 family protein [Embleya sp. NPDC127516]|uniref:SAV_915 family protein n=1 Tax=Embleya sp. NPDC127516 TaxID=3363990 RepID=UPI00381603D5
MSDVLITDEEPASATTARRVLIVPVRSVDGARVVRLCRDPLGARVVVAFTSVARLRAVLGADQEWIRLGAGAVRSLADEVGGERMLVDPGLSAPPVRHQEPVGGAVARDSAADGAVGATGATGMSGVVGTPGVVGAAVVPVAIDRASAAGAARPPAAGLAPARAVSPTRPSLGRSAGGLAPGVGSSRVSVGPSRVSGASRSVRDPQPLGGLRTAVVAVLLVVLSLLG